MGETDLISRQAAIDRINKQREHLEPDVYPQDKIGDAAYRICAEFIGRLPSVQPNVRDFQKDADTISRQAAIDALDSFILDDVTDVHGDTVREILERLTTIEERKTGKWIETDSNEPCWFKCDQCGRLSDIKEIYCPTCGASMANTTCGADMRGEADG